MEDVRHGHNQSPLHNRRPSNSGHFCHTQRPLLWYCQTGIRYSHKVDHECFGILPPLRSVPAVRRGQGGIGGAMSQMRDTAEGSHTVTSISRTRAENTIDFHRHANAPAHGVLRCAGLPVLRRRGRWKALGLAPTHPLFSPFLILHIRMFSTNIFRPGNQILSTDDNNTWKQLSKGPLQKNVLVLGASSREKR